MEEILKEENKEQGTSSLWLGENIVSVSSVHGKTNIPDFWSSTILG
jgi:hypothetical protein